MAVDGRGLLPVGGLVVEQGIPFGNRTGRCAADPITDWGRPGGVAMEEHTPSLTS